MTPFEAWYSREVVPKLPTDCHPMIRQASKEAMAACWNAAIKAVCETIEEFYPPEPGRIMEQAPVMLRVKQLQARVTL